jgi:hypothetical protein
MKSITVVVVDMFGHEFQSVPADVFGDFASHRDPRYYAAEMAGCSESECEDFEWSVTHVPSGMATAHHVSQCDAMEIARSLGVSLRCPTIDSAISERHVINSVIAEVLGEDRTAL